MEYFAVIDTNVVVSALYRWDSIPGKIIEHALVGEIHPLLNEKIVTEYREVTARPKLKFDKSDITHVIDGLIQRGIFLDGIPSDEPVNDPKDVIFYEVTLDARQSDEAYLVTGNIKDFPIKPFVVTPREMLDIIEKNS